MLGQIFGIHVSFQAGSSEGGDTLIQEVHTSHLVIVERKVEHRDILFEPVLLDALGDNNVTLLDQVAKKNLQLFIIIR